MGRYISPACKLCRREGMKLFLKGHRCYTDKCAFERREYAPGQHGQGRSKLTEYSLQLREKQKVKRMYGLLERQFRGYFRKAERQKGVTGENLLRLLECRLDNVVYRLGFATSRNDARQLVRHGHILLNGKKVDIPSCLVREGGTIELRERSKALLRVQDALAAQEGRGIPHWLEFDKTNIRGRVIGIPAREDIGLPIQEQLIVELYSK